MKIFFLVHDFRAGGAERVAVTILNELVQRGHSVKAVTYSANPDHYELDDRIVRERIDFRGIGPEAFSKKSWLYRAVVFFRRFPLIRRSIKTYHPDVVLSFQTKTNIYCLLGSLGLGSPVIVSEHSFRWAHSQSRRTDLFRRIVYPLAAKVVVLTEEDRLNYPGLRRVVVIPNPNPFRDCPVQRPKKDKLILGVGRIVPIKGFDLLIEAIALIGSTGLKGFKVVIVGDGHDRRGLEDRVQSLCLSGLVTFTGQSRNMAEFYFTADIFVLSSRFEGLPMALIEAMAFGCAPVAFNCPVGPRAIITDGSDGILVPEKDTALLALAISRLIDSETDRDRMGREALVSSARFSVTVITDRWEALFTEVLKR